uniref:Uncharacterized protein n=1 Tax=Cannabis sativa TaxID=3483 RepID=A0A803Q7J9_CANSA
MAHLLNTSFASSSQTFGGTPISHRHSSFLVAGAGSTSRLRPRTRAFQESFNFNGVEVVKRPLLCASTFSMGQTLWLISVPFAQASESIKYNAVYEEQVRSGDASATEYFELGAVMLRRKFYPAATKYLLQAIDKWDGDDQDLAQVYNALGVSYVMTGKLEKGITQFETAVKIQPGYVTAWNNLGDAYEKKKEFKSALKAFEEVLLFDPNNKLARPRRDALKEQVDMYRGVPVKSKVKSKEGDFHALSINTKLVPLVF